MQPLQETKTDPDAHLTISDVQGICHLKCKKTVRKWMKRGILPYYRITNRVIRFKRQDVLAFIERYRIERRSNNKVIEEAP